MWRLHHRQFFLFQEPAHRHLQERARWHVVAVKDGDELPGGILQGVVNVTGLRVFMSGTGDVLHADLLRKLAKLGAATVIRDPDFELIFRPVDT